MNDILKWRVQEGRGWKMKANLRNLRKFYDKKLSKEILKVVNETDKEKLFSYEEVKNLIDSCYNPPSFLDCQLVALNELLGGYGVEYTPNYDEGLLDVLGIEYINTGDTYSLTTIYDHEREEFFISSWGDYVEKQMRRFFGWK